MCVAPISSRYLNELSKPFRRRGVIRLKGLLDNAAGGAPQRRGPCRKIRHPAAGRQKSGARPVRQFAAIAIAQQMCLLSLAGLLK
jgi:hypothetical protein